MNFTILYFDSLGSTNDEARDQAKVGAAEGLCIVAGQQTAGRGRNGRNWVSEKDAGLFFSIVLRPKFEMRHFPLITLAAGIAAFDTLASFGVEPDIKWVNDILVGEKKICGILAEMTDTNSGPAVILGVGINLRSYNFPPEIADIATSLEAETLSEHNAKDVLAKFTELFSKLYSSLANGGETGILLDEWARRSSFYSGKHVRIKLADGEIEGVTDGLLQDGSLRVKKDDGEISVVTAGDVKNLRPAV